MDCQMSVCTIVLCPDDAHQMPKVIEFLTASGVTIDSVDKDHGVIECTGEAGLMKGLEKSDLFEYVRVSMTYCAEFPPGDPRDTNGI